MMKETKTINKWDYILFGVLGAICFLVFQHGDIRHTAGCSYAYLQGHILDFYEWNAQVSGMHASYMPSTYILFAIWNIPIKLLGIVTGPRLQASYGLLMWYKLLPTMFYMASAFLMYKIALELGMEEGKSKLCMYAFLTTPIGFFSQFIFGQYDSFTVFFMLLGIYYYFKDNRKLFVLFFGLSIPFKYFSLLIFVPLLLLKEKNVWKILRDLLLAAIPYAVLLVIYLPSELFRDYVLGFMPTDYVYSASIQAGSTSLSLVVASWGLICAWAYFKNPGDKLLLARWSCYLSSLVAFVIFGLSQWHPQWLLFAVPFWVLGAFLQRETKAFWAVDVIMMLFFCIFTVNVYFNNVDQSLFGWGLFGHQTLGKRIMPYMGVELAMRDLYFTKNISFAGTVFTAFLALIAVFKHPNFGMQPVNQPIANGMRWLNIRFVTGLAVFLIPAGICYGAAALPPHVSLDISRGGIPDVPVLEEQISQVFMPETDDTIRLDFFAATYGRTNPVTLEVTISEYETGAVIQNQSFDCSRFKNNSWVSIKIPKGSLKKDVRYRIDFDCENVTTENCICLYKTEQRVDENTFAMVEGKVQAFNLYIRLYTETRGQRKMEKLS